MITGARHLIVNADDFGLSAGVNRGIVEAYDNGIVTSASLMVHKPAAAQAAALARSRPSLDLGLHIDIGEWHYQDGDWLPMYEHVSQDDPLALKAAVVEQLQLFRRLVGTEPTHLDSHQHAHKREPLRSIVQRLGAQWLIPVRHLDANISYCGNFYGQDEEGKPLPDGLRVPFLVGIIQNLRDDITELCCHPAAELDFVSPYSEERLEELKVLCSSVVHQVIERAGVVLASFAELRPPEEQLVSDYQPHSKMEGLHSITRTSAV